MAGPRRVLLVCPPFQNPHIASLATAGLATLLRERGGSAVEAYPHLAFAELVGVERYLAAGDGTSLTGELLFAEGLHGSPADGDLVAMLDEAFGPFAAREALRSAFADRVHAIVDLREVDLVGLTTSFNQLMAALWLGRLLKRRRPELEIVLGGAACVAPMGAALLAGYPEVDFVVSGWGEAPLLALSRGEHRARALLEACEPVDLDALPIPDFAPLLTVASEAQLARPIALTFESSRGCWWGQKHHCRFCGVNGTTLAYHSKSSERVVRELRTLWDLHGRNLIATDAVLSREHLDEVIPELGRHDEGPQIFYELRTNATAEQVESLARARVQGQPGIESLSTRLLQLMGKGQSAIQNLAFLKWAAELGVPLAWNLLYAIPGELPVDYERQIELIELIPQLTPPVRINPIHLARHSPFFEERDTYGWRDVTPLPEYFGMHPHLDAAQRFAVAKYFRGTSPVDPEGYVARLAAARERWQERHTRGEGLFLDASRGLVRNGEREARQYAPSPTIEAVVEATHEIASLSQVCTATRAPRPLIQALVDAGILFVEGDRVVNLAVRIGRIVRPR